MQCAAACSQPFQALAKRLTSTTENANFLSYLRKVTCCSLQSSRPGKGSTALPALLGRLEDGLSASGLAHHPRQTQPGSRGPADTSQDRPSSDAAPLLAGAVHPPVDVAPSDHAAAVPGDAALAPVGVEAVDAVEIDALGAAADWMAAASPVGAVQLKRVRSRLADGGH